MGPYELEAARALLTLREILVRFDENAKARTLMDECVPYLIERRRDVQAARADQRAMTEHMDSPQALLAYYTANEHDRPYEQQYGLDSAVQALDAIPRFGLLAKALKADPRPRVSVLDLACNDGILAAALRGVGLGADRVDYAGLDASRACIQRARDRALDAAFYHGAIETFRFDRKFDHVVMYEVLEHAIDPEAMLAHAARRVTPGGTLWVSTPAGAVERGELPGWDHVEPKGHLWAWDGAQFLALCEPHGRVKGGWTTGDGVNVLAIEVPADA